MQYHVTQMLTVPSTPKNHPRSSGFALVITLSLMVLLTLLAVGLLSLSSVALRSSAQGEAQAVARSNARMALILAIGELQRLTGPDQRVTGASALLQGAGSSPPAHSRWIGAWRTNSYKDDSGPSPIIRPNTNGSGFSDRRSSGGYDAKTQVLGWLVSGYEPSPQMELSADKSVVAWSGTTPVQVPRVGIAEGGRQGAFAYHVSDESLKAKISLVDPYEPQQPALASAGSPGFNRWVAPLSNDPAVWFPGAKLDLGQAAKLASTAEVELSSLAAGKTPEMIREMIRKQGSEFTVYSRSVLADPVQGGLKRDLTSYLEDNRAPALGSLPAITDNTVITSALAGRAKSGPKFGMLRNWYLLGRQGTGAGSQRTLEVQTPNTTGSGVRIVDPGAAFIKPVIQPVLTEAVYYLRHVVEGGKLVELLYPRVVLWNPFSAKLRTQGHVVLFDYRLDHKLQATVDGAAAAAALNLNLNFNYNLDQHPGFYLPPTVFEPGEALVFYAPAKNTTLNTSNLCANTLSATASASSLGFFRRDWPGTLPVNATSANTKISYGANSSICWNTNQRTQTITLHAVKGTPTVTGSSLLNGGEPAVRQLSVDNYSRGNNGRWLPGYSPPRVYSLTEVMSGNVPPDSLLAFGSRFRFIYETYANRIQGAGNQEPWYYAPLIDHNIAAPNFHRWPLDNIFGMEYTALGGVGVVAGPHLYSYGPLAQARQWSEWLDPEVMPHRSPAGKNRTAVFCDASFATGESTYPVYDLPSKWLPLTSLGALQHVPLSPFAWHPSHIIGQSFPSPYVPMASVTTSRTTQAETSLWAEKAANLSSSLNADITGFDNVPGEVLLNDISYEVNQVLWDRFFLSGIPRPDAPGAAWDGDRWDLKQPLPNARLAINPAFSHSGAKQDLLDHHRAAYGLWLEGGFNIHSTSVNAWASLLRSFRDIEIPSLAEEEGTTAPAAFPGHAIAQGKGTNAALKATRDTYWNAYRKLSNQEIDALAQAIVLQVRKRAPFIGMADFVNRRLVSPTNSSRAEFAFGGVLQSAIEQQNIINGTNPDWLLPTEGIAGSFKYGAPYWGGPIADPEPQDYKAFLVTNGGKPRQAGADAASQLTQADILQQLGSVLVARGDTFVVRAYGEARNMAGKVTATAWCEAVVQRSPEPVNPDSTMANLNPKIVPGTIDWGRKYVIESFRWLREHDI